MAKKKATKKHPKPRAGKVVGPSGAERNVVWKLAFKATSANKTPAAVPSSAFFSGYTAGWHDGYLAAKWPKEEKR